MKPEIIRIVTNGVRAELQSRVRDRVYCYESNGTLYVQVVNQQEFTVIYQHEVPDFLTRMGAGTSCRDIAGEVCRSYRKEILSRYFVDFYCKNR